MKDLSPGKGERLSFLLLLLLLMLSKSVAFAPWRSSVSPCVVPASLEAKFSPPPDADYSPAVGGLAPEITSSHPPADPVSPEPYANVTPVARYYPAPSLPANGPVPDGAEPSHAARSSESKPPQPPKAVATTQVTKPQPPKRRLNLNAADTLELIAVRGIGRYSAERILAYRKALGGFSDLGQLDEIKALRQENLPWLKEQAYIDPSLIQPLDIARGSVEKLMRHPYLDFYQARAIVQLRDAMGGQVLSADDLEGLEEFTPEQLKKLRPYWP